MLTCRLRRTARSRSPPDRTSLCGGAYKPWLPSRRSGPDANRTRAAAPPRQAHVGLNALQRVLGDEECNFHRAVVSPKTHRAPRRIERAALVGKTQRHRRPFAAVHADVGSRHRPWPPAERGARSSYPLNPARYLLRARMMAVAPKQVAAAKATLKRVITMSRSLMIAGGSATGLSATGAWIVRVLWPMMVAKLRLTRAIVQGSSTFIVDHISLLNPLREPRTISIFELGLVCRADLVRAHPKGNADFGWAVARWSCGPRSGSCRHGGHDGYWHSEMVQPDEGLWVHSAAGRRQRRVRPYLGGRAGRPELSQRGPSAQLRAGQQPRQAGGGKSQNALTATSSSTA